METRVKFVVDGFNLYHSIRDLHARTGRNYRWLDIDALCRSFLSAMGNGASVEGIHYFTALAHHRERWDPGTVKRHRMYIDALEAT